MRCMSGALHVRREDEGENDDIRVRHARMGDGIIQVPHPNVYTLTIGCVLNSPQCCNRQPFQTWGRDRSAGCGEGGGDVEGCRGKNGRRGDGAGGGGRKKG